MKKRIIKLTEEDIKNITVKCINEVFNQMNDDLIEYCRLRPSDTGLNVEIFLDDGGAYKRNGHPLWVYMQNNYNDISDVIPIELDSVNQVMLGIPKNIGINTNDYQNVLKYIKQNKELIEQLANWQIGHLDYINLHKKIQNSEDGKTMVLNEMATLRPCDSNLPTTLWIDEGSSPQHGPRIKFQASNEQRTTREFTSMSISGNPQIFNLPRNIYLSNKDIEKIKKFVILNSDMLLAVANGEMKYMDFLRMMIKVD